MTLPMKLGSVVASLVVLGAGCSKPSGPPTYEYAIFSGHLPNASSVEVFLAGKSVGKASAATIPRDVFISDRATKLELAIPTTCGIERVAVTSSDGDRAEEEKRRALGGAIRWEVFVPAEIREVPLYLDNAENAKPATIRIGTREESLAAGEARGTQMLVAGRCPTALDLAIDGRAAGKLPPVNTNGAMLVSATADACYAKGYAEYVVGSSFAASSGILPEVQVFRIEGHATVIPKVEYFPQSAAPKEKLMAADDRDTTVSLMTPISCTVAVAVLKAREGQ